MGRDCSVNKKKKRKHSKKKKTSALPDSTNLLGRNTKQNTDILLLRQQIQQEAGERYFEPTEGVLEQRVCYFASDKHQPPPPSTYTHTHTPPAQKRKKTIWALSKLF